MPQYWYVTKCVLSLHTARRSFIKHDQMEQNCVPNKIDRLVNTARLKILLFLLQLSTFMAQSKSDDRFTTKRPSLTNTIKAIPGTPVRQCICSYSLFPRRHCKLIELCAVFSFRLNICKTFDYMNSCKLQIIIWRKVIRNNTCYCKVE